VFFMDFYCKKLRSSFKRFFKVNFYLKVSLFGCCRYNNLVLCVLVKKYIVVNQLASMSQAVQEVAADKAERG
jgi:hypothetical protein